MMEYMCVGCKKTNREVEECRIRLVRFNVFGAEDQLFDSLFGPNACMRSRQKEGVVCA